LTLFMRASRSRSAQPIRFHFVFAEGGAEGKATEGRWNPTAADHRRLRQLHSDKKLLGPLNRNGALRLLRRANPNALHQQSSGAPAMDWFTLEGLPLGSGGEGGGDAIMPRAPYFVSVVLGDYSRLHHRLYNDGPVQVD